MEIERCESSQGGMRRRKSEGHRELYECLFTRKVVRIRNYNKREGIGHNRCRLLYEKVFGSSLTARHVRSGHTLARGREVCENALSDNVASLIFRSDMEIEAPLKTKVTTGVEDIQWQDRTGSAWYCLSRERHNVGASGASTQ